MSTLISQLNYHLIFIMCSCIPVPVSPYQYRSCVLKTGPNFFSALTSCEIKYLQGKNKSGYTSLVLLKHVLSDWEMFIFYSRLFSCLYI